ncbi:hypothetical protein ACXET9_14010 [Brachybacterium sp. DNPG3]
MEVASSSEEFPAEIGLAAGTYDVHFEICDGFDDDEDEVDEDEEESEVYYRFTFVPAAEPGSPRFLLDDPWGGEEGLALQNGRF